MPNIDPKLSEGRFSMTPEEKMKMKPENKKALEEKLGAANERLVDSKRRNAVIDLEDPGVSAEDLVEEMKKENEKKKKTWH